jgi:glycosyltransferase involved in cell wall biosynthesis
MAGLPPIISIITPTYNRADELVHLYESLKKQTVDLKLFEFIISDDGSTDITQSMVEEWQFNSPFKIKFGS